MTPREQAPIYNGRPGESFADFYARRTAEFAAAIGPNFDAPPPSNPDAQRQWPELGSTS